MTEFRLGKGITMIVPFHRLRDDKEHVPIKKEKPKEILTTELVITMVVIAIVKVSVLLL